MAHPQEFNFQHRTYAKPVNKCYFKFQEKGLFFWALFPPYLVATKTS